jgi:hypothetical protein
MWLQVIYTGRKNTYQAYKSDVAREIENSMYTCGNSLFQSGHELEHVVVVRLAMTCTSTIERQYYKAGFATLCCYCADAEVATTSAALSMTYEFVYPTCAKCRVTLPERTYRKRKKRTFASKAGLELQKAKLRKIVGHRGAAARSKQISKRKREEIASSNEEEGEGQGQEGDSEEHDTDDGGNEEHEWLHVAAAFHDVTNGTTAYRVLWVPGDFSDELDETQSVFPSISHSEMELEGEMVGKVIRVYWGKEKTWFTGVVASFDMETKFHTVSYSDGDDEDIDMLSLDSDRPAWEISPFSEAYFGF